MLTKGKSPGANAAGRVASILVAIVAITPLPIMARSVQHMYAERDGIAMGVDEQATGSVHVARAAVKTATHAAQTLTVAVAQTASNETTTPEAMAVHMIGFVADAAARGARVVVFPEMAVVGYWPETINCSRCYERLPKVESTLAEAARAHNVYLIFGIPHFVNTTHYYNTALVIDPTGAKIYRQAKIAIAWAMDGMPGHWLDTFEIDGVPVSLMICASEFTPEIARLPALKGSKVLFYISYEGDVSKYVERYQASNPKSNMRFDVAYQVLPQARAIENRMFVIQANAAEMVQNVGTMGGSHGESKILDTLGHVLAEGPVFGETLLIATLNLAEASPPTFEQMREQLPMFAKMWEAGMATVFSRMPIDMQQAM